MASDYKNYAQALFELAKEEKREDEIYEEIILIDSVLAENKDYFKIFSSPDIKLNEKNALIDSAFSGASDTLIKFMKLLASKGALKVFGSCAKGFSELYFKDKGIVLAKVKSSVNLSESEMKKLTEKLETKTGKKVRLTNVVEPNLLGGAVLEYDGKEFDGSIKARLNSLKKSLG